MPKVDPIRDKMDIQRIEHVLRYYSYRDWFAFRFGNNTALRCGDMLQIKVRQAKELYLNLRESKTRKYRHFYINEHLRPIIADYVRFMHDDDYLFRPITENRPPTISQLYRSLRDAGRRVNVPNVGTHTMRKTFAYHFYRDTGRIAELMEILNHSSERQTLIYIGVIQEEIDELVKQIHIGGETPWIVPV